MRGSAAAGRIGVLSRTLLAKVQTQTPLMLGAEAQTRDRWRVRENTVRENQTQSEEKKGSM